jgi:hypothetical protein
MLYREVLGLGMMQDDSRGRQLRNHLHGFGQLDTDEARLEEREDDLLALEIRTSRIPEAIASASNHRVGLTARPGLFWRRNPELSSHAIVPVFGQGLGELHCQPMPQKIVAVGVAMELLGDGVYELLAKAYDK